jgi:hypothetical protein
MPGFIDIAPYLVTAGARTKRKQEIVVPTLSEMVTCLEKLGLRSDHIGDGSTPTALGQMLLDYFRHRSDAIHAIECKLMDVTQASALYAESVAKYIGVVGKQPMNRQKGTKRAKAFLTCLVNLIIAAHASGYPCDYDPQLLTKLTKDKIPFRTLARRVDGAFTSTNDPIAIWEIKEYYYTTTFGSRIADGVYETLVDGMEIEEATASGCTTKHYLMVDSYYTWWGCGKSYLCRIVDMLHMGYVDEVLFGREVAEELPRIVQSWVAQAEAIGLPREENL